MFNILCYSIRVVLAIQVFSILITTFDSLFSVEHLKKRGNLGRKYCVIRLKSKG
jgi:hypothetical protein